MIQSKARLRVVDTSLSGDRVARELDRIAETRGYKKTKRLFDVSFNVKQRIPLANKWLAQRLCCQGLPVAAIARRLRRSDTTVRKYISGSNVARAA